MPFLRDVRELVLQAYAADAIDEEECLLLYDINHSGNLDPPYWKYQTFDLDLLTDDECKGELRFYKNDVYRLSEALNLPDQFIFYNGLVVDKVEAICVLLKRFAYPCRYLDMVSRFGRPTPELCVIANHTMDLVFNQWSRLLSNMNQNWLSPVALEAYAHAVHQAGAALPNCWGFVDGTVRPVCRPEKNQRVLYNGHKKVHSIKFQSVTAPNGLIANLYGPVEGRRHDSGMLTDSGLLTSLQQFCFDTNGNPLCIYGDPAYPLRVHLQSPFKGARLTPNQQEFNKSMSRVRVSVEWIFNDILNYFKFLDFKKNMKVQLSAVGKMYLTCGILHNARICLYKSITSNYFEVEPPSLEDYFA